MKWLKTLLIYLSIIIISFVVGFLIFIITSDYDPPHKKQVYKSDKPDVLSDTATYRLLIWNIGYGGLSAEMDFFYDGGEKVRPSEKILRRNLKAIKDELYNHRNKDFILLQEVDKKAKRSYHINQYQELANWYESYIPAYGKNYDVAFVPIPLRDPMGHVNAGVMTLSEKKPVRAVRHAFPGDFSFPVNYFMLDRCFLVNRYMLDNGSQLVVVNTHNSAYDNGKLKKQEMAMFKKFLVKEWEKGHYVIAGGDWNQSPPGFNPDFDKNVMDNKNRSDISPDYLPEWTWAYDNSVPTNRRLMKPYKKGKSPTTVIDFYLLSPNIRLKNVQTINRAFKYSDHQPVELSIALEN